MAVVCDEAMLFEVSEAKEACVSLGWPFEQVEGQIRGRSWFPYFLGQQFLSQ